MRMKRDTGSSYIILITPILMINIMVKATHTKVVILEILVAIYHHHHISVMEMGHLLTRSGLMYPEVSSKVCHDSFCQLGNSVSLPWVIHYGAFYLFPKHAGPEAEGSNPTTGITLR